MEWHEGKRSLGLQMFIYDGMAASAMYSFTSMFLVAFALSLGATSMDIGLLSALPTLFWTLALIPSAILAQRYIRRRRDIVVGFATASRLIWVPIILIPLMFAGNSALAALIVLTVLATAVGAFSSPAWATMTGDLVPDRTRGRYFGRRAVLSTIAGLSSALVAGWLLDVFGRQTPEGFMLIFAIGIFFGLLSSWFFSRIPDPPITVDSHTRPKEALRTACSDSKFRRYLILIFVWEFGVMFASPFFNVQLLEVLKADYIWISVLAVVGGIAGIAVSRAWGRFSDRYGHRPIIIISAFGAALTPLLWIPVQNPYFLIPIEIFTSIMWAGFNLSYYNYMLAASPAKSRAMYSALLNVVFGVGGILAPILGGAAAEFFKASPLLGLSYLQPVFLISGIIRLAAFVLFLKFLYDIEVTKPHVPVGYVAGEMLRKGIEGGILKLHYAGEVTAYDAVTIEQAVAGKAKKGKNVFIRTLEHIENTIERIGIWADRIAEGIMIGQKKVEEDSELALQEGRLKAEGD